MVDLRHPWSIGPVEIPTRLVLAPMAGVSVQAFRRQGTTLRRRSRVLEMVSCAGSSTGTSARSATCASRRRASARDPALRLGARSMAEAARMVEAAGADLVDLNFGCPVRKVTKTGAGATLLDDPTARARSSPRSPTRSTSRSA
jgi:tRNA-dihydrouridine synthase B